MKTNFDLSEFITILGEDLITIFDRSSKYGIHPDEVGKAKEINISKQIEMFLPNGVGVGRGFVFDSYGNISNQCDLILYEKNLIPVFVRDDNTEYSYYPCEGVIAVGEIKSTLNIDEFNSSILKLEKIKNMKRHFNDPHNFRKYLSPLVACGAESEMFLPNESSYDNIFTFIFCKENVISLNTIIDSLIQKYNSCMEKGVDRIYSLNKELVSKLRYDAPNSWLFSQIKSNAYSSFVTSALPFGLLANDISTFVQHGRTQKFYLEDYYKIDDLYINKSTFKTID